METKKITFLFGAGAESTGNYDLPMGLDYMVRTLCAAKWQGKYRDALRDFFTENYYVNAYDEKLHHYYQYTQGSFNLYDKIAKHIFYQKALKDKEFFEKYFEDLSIILLERKTKFLIRHHKSNATFQKPSQKSTEGFLLLRKFLRNELEGNEDFEIIRDILEKKDECIKLQKGVELGNGNLLDAYFHSINNPVKYGTSKFSIIINYYWACYFVIIESIFRYFKKLPLESLFFKDNNIDSEYFEKYFEEGQERLNYKKVLNELSDVTNVLYGLDLSNANETSYYNCILKEMNKSAKLKCRAVLTTNYFQFCNVMQKSENKTDTFRTIYLNGELKNFEFPELLSVMEMGNPEFEEYKDKNIFFPFIFGQSLVKPIVHSKQIEEYHRMHEVLNDTDVLVILGFNINEDDNHINAFLHEFLTKEGKKIIYVTESERREQVAQRLRVNECCHNQIECIHVKFGSSNNEAIIKKIFNKLEEEK